jgi:hypothetical protein
MLSCDNLQKRISIVFWSNVFLFVMFVHFCSLKYWTDIDGTFTHLSVSDIIKQYPVILSVKDKKE